MINPHKEKYFDFYWQVAYAAAEQSVAERRKVGACLVLPTGMLSIGWNGTPPGFDNTCESMQNRAPPLQRSRELVTKPEVIHAERNAIDKMTRQGIPTAGSIMFLTGSPCFNCALSLSGLGLKAIYYASNYRSEEGVELLKQAGVPCHYTPTPQSEKERPWPQTPTTNPRVSA